MRLRPAALATVALSALVMSCQLLLGIRDADFDVADGGSGGNDGGVEASNEAGTSCSAPLPPRPPVGTGGGDGGTYIVAMKTIVLGGGPNAGFDLDRTCTCTAEDPAQARASCVHPKTSRGCDLDGGVDNALLTITSGFAKASVDKFNDNINDTLDCGRQTVLLVLQDYNGGPDDDKVVVFADPSFGIRAPHTGGEGPDGNRCLPTYPARWDGTDRWGSARIREDGYVTFPSFEGYVRDHQLVVDGRDQPSPGPIALTGLGGDPLRVHRPVIVAKLESRDGGLELKDGVLAGRVLATDVLTSFGKSVPPDGGERYCQDDEFKVVQTLFCQAADIMSNPDRDFVGDRFYALSVVVGFTATPAAVAPGAAPVDPEIDAPPCTEASLACP